MKGKTKNLGCKLPDLATICAMKEMIAARADSMRETLTRFKRLAPRAKTPAVQGQIRSFATIVGYLDGFWAQLDQTEARMRLQAARGQTQKKTIE